MMTIQVLVLSYLPHKMIFTGYPFIKCPSPNRGTLPSDLRLVLIFFTQRTAAVQKIEGHTDGKPELHSSFFSGGLVLLPVAAFRCFLIRDLVNLTNYRGATRKISHYKKVKSDSTYHFYLYFLMYFRILMFRLKMA